MEWVTFFSGILFVCFDSFGYHHRHRGEHVYIIENGVPNNYYSCISDRSTVEPSVYVCVLWLSFGVCITGNSVTTITGYPSISEVNSKNRNRDGPQYYGMIQR